MATFTAAIDVDAAPDAVWAYLADHRHAVDWDPTVVESELVDSAVVGDGAVFDATVAFYGRRLPVRYTLHDRGRPAHLAFDATGKKLVGALTFDIAAHDGGSRIDYRLDIGLTGMLRLLGKGLGAAIEGIGEKSADGIRRALSD